MQHEMHMDDTKMTILQSIIHEEKIACMIHMLQDIWHNARQEKSILPKSIHHDIWIHMQCKMHGRHETRLNNQEGSHGNTPHKRKLRGKEEPPKVSIEYHRKDTNWTITTGSQKSTKALEIKFPSKEAELPLNQRQLAKQKARERESKREALKPIGKKERQKSKTQPEDTISPKPKESSKDTT